MPSGKKTSIKDQVKRNSRHIINADSSSQDSGVEKESNMLKSYANYANDAHRQPYQSTNSSKVEDTMFSNPMIRKSVKKEAKRPSSRNVGIILMLEKSRNRCEPVISKRSKGCKTTTSS